MNNRLPLWTRVRCDAYDHGDLSGGGKLARGVITDYSDDGRYGIADEKSGYCAGYYAHHAVHERESNARQWCRTASTLVLCAYALACVAATVVRWELQERRAR